LKSVHSARKTAVAVSSQHACLIRRKPQYAEDWRLVSILVVEGEGLLLGVLYFAREGKEGRFQSPGALEVAKGARADEEPDRLPCIRYPTWGFQELCKEIRPLIQKAFPLHKLPP
jgi:hypothetical protein